MRSLSLETRRHYLAPHREESQLWKSWKSAPDAFFGAIRTIQATGDAYPRQKTSHFPRRLASENGFLG
jgi:hypothetical protein